jgi:hypothetical protein
MTAGSTSPRLLRVSLRELLAAFALMGVGCAALKYAGEVWWTVLSAAMLVGFLVAVIVAVVGRGPGQARAIGFVLCVGIYAVLIWSAQVGRGNGQNRELDPYEGRLPTTKLLKPLFEKLVARTWFDSFTGNEVPNYSPPPGVGVSGMGIGGAMYVRESPDRGQFMAIGHLLWAVLFGYLGCRFAVWVAARRRQQETPSVGA